MRPNSFEVRQEGDGRVIAYRPAKHDPDAAMAFLMPVLILSAFGICSNLEELGIQDYQLGFLLYGVTVVALYSLIVFTMNRLRRPGWFAISPVGVVHNGRTFGRERIRGFYVKTPAVGIERWFRGSGSDYVLVARGRTRMAAQLALLPHLAAASARQAHQEWSQMGAQVRAHSNFGVGVLYDDAQGDLYVTLAKGLRPGAAEALYAEVMQTFWDMGRCHYKAFEHPGTYKPEWRNSKFAAGNQAVSQ